MKLIKTSEAVGHILCHDITRIVPGVVKDAAFRKGHRVREEDIPALLAMGKENLYVWEQNEYMLHEDEAAQILYDICAGAQTSMTATPAKEGKIKIVANEDGLFKLDARRLYEVNALGEIMIAARCGDVPVRKGDVLGAVRVIPLVIEKAKMKRAKDASGESPLMRTLPFVLKRAGVVTTGNEVFSGKIEDAFTPAVEKKLAEYGVEISEHTILGDEPSAVSEAVLSMIENGADIVICTGGMSVDPDDRTPLAIRNTGADIVTYGAPVSPGAMFLLSYYKKGERKIPVIGLPGCVMYCERTIFDILLPRLSANDPIAAEDIFALGEGGLCLECEICVYPNCGFGRGSRPKNP
ncbi:MAG: molybdopterin-binding protein [Clostridiales Family XIII bacterium]|jgi:molybdenum cofactor synthesis domain-containing protein|nr:molybdopterin-binding protein [Clostridiales Family XIII bacterium]